MRSRRGFSIIELMVVMVVIGLIARIGIPRYRDMKARAIAARLVGDVSAIRLAAYTEYADKNTWPADYGPGTVPTELRPYLPEGFSFTKPEYQLDWEIWPLPAGTTGVGSGDVMLGVTVNASDATLAGMAYRMALPGYALRLSTTSVMFFVSGGS